MNDLIHTIDQLEEVVNNAALIEARKMKLDLQAHQFRIHFLDNAPFDAQLHAGSCVHIYTTIPPIPAKEFRANMRQWLRQIPKLLRKYEMVSTTDVYRWSQENKKLIKTAGLIEELVPTLVPTYRLKTKIITKIVMTDKVTGLEEIIETEDRKVNENDLAKIAHSRLSRRVNEKEKAMYPDEIVEEA